MFFLYFLTVWPLSVSISHFFLIDFLLVQRSHSVSAFPAFNIKLHMDVTAWEIWLFLIKIRLSVCGIVSCRLWWLKTHQNSVFLPTSFWGLSQTVAVVHQFRSRLLQQPHHKLLQTEGSSVPHGSTASWFSRIFASSLSILFCVILSLFSPTFPSLLRSQMWLQFSCRFISLATTLPSDYFPALLSISPNPFVQISPTYITLHTSSLLCLHPTSFLVFCL